MGLEPQPFCWKMRQNPVEKINLQLSAQVALRDLLPPHAPRKRDLAFNVEGISHAESTIIGEEPQRRQFNVRCTCHHFSIQVFHRGHRLSKLARVDPLGNRTAAVDAHRP